VAFHRVIWHRPFGFAPGFRSPFPSSRDKNNDEEFLVDIIVGACETFDQKGQDTGTVFGK